MKINLILFLLFSSISHAQTTEFEYPSNAAIIAHRMVDAMDDLTQGKSQRRYKKNTRWGENLPNHADNRSKLEQQNYWMQTNNPYSWTEPHKKNNQQLPSHSWLPAPPQGVAALEHYLTVLDGSWQGSANDVLIIRGDKFRLYVNPKQFRDGYISVNGNQLTMILPSEKTQKVFEFAEFNGQLALRSQQGIIIRYQLISKY